MTKIVGYIFIVTLSIACTHRTHYHSSITKWPENKQSAISITYDDGIINQMTVARPIMNQLGIPGTFYIITGKVEGSGKGKFIGRAPKEIIAETATIKTDSSNFFERASLIAFTGTTQAVEYHSNAGSLFERGMIKEAYELIDEGFKKIRNGQLKNTNDVVFHDNPVDTTTWEQYKQYAAEGHEIASHTVTHARMAVLDETNLRYELEQSKADIQKYLGEKYTFSAECPYGTENERVMEYAQQIYPALRNRMPAPYLEELNRSSKVEPGKSEKEYVQWQRGPLSNISLDKMKSWVDTCLAHDNIWLVLVFHGIDGIGWEPSTGEELESYFSYMKKQNDKLWIATFADVTKYIRERKSTMLSTKNEGDEIVVKVASNLDSKTYNVPLTLKTYIPNSWKMVKINGQKSDLKINKDKGGNYVLHSYTLGSGEIRLSS